MSIVLRTKNLIKVELTFRLNKSRIKIQNEDNEDLRNVVSVNALWHLLLMSPEFITYDLLPLILI